VLSEQGQTMKCVSLGGVSHETCETEDASPQPARPLMELQCPSEFSHQTVPSVVFGFDASLSTFTVAGWPAGHLVHLTPELSKGSSASSPGLVLSYRVLQVPRPPLA